MKFANLCYKVQAAKNNILVSGQMVQFEVPQERFREEATRLLNYIKSIRGSENIDGIEHFMEEIKCSEVCAKSSDMSFLLYTRNSPLWFTVSPMTSNCVDFSIILLPIRISHVMNTYIFQTVLRLLFLQYFHNHISPGLNNSC